MKFRWSFHRCTRRLVENTVWLHTCIYRNVLGVKLLSEARGSSKSFSCFFALTLHLLWGLGALTPCIFFKDILCMNVCFLDDDEGRTLNGFFCPWSRRAGDFWGVNSLLFLSIGASGTRRRAGGFFNNWSVCFLGTRSGSTATALYFHCFLGCPLTSRSCKLNLRGSFNFLFARWSCGMGWLWIRCRLSSVSCPPTSSSGCYTDQWKKRIHVNKVEVCTCMLWFIRTCRLVHKHDCYVVLSLWFHV